MEAIVKVVYSIAPWVVGVVCFWLVGYHFYAPQFDGKSLSQGDIAQYAGMSKDIKEHREATGEDPQWTGNMFAGMPAYLIDVEYPEQYVKHTASPLIKSVDGPMNMTLWAMILMMVAVVLMGVNPWIGIIAGLAYGLSTYFFLIIDAGHITKMWALVYAPPLVGAVWYALRRNMWAGAALAALFGSLELGANHPQITYYFLLACVALWISQLWTSWREKALKEFGYRTAVLAVAALLAVGSNVAPLWYTVEHQKYTTRSDSEATSPSTARNERIAYNTAWSYGIGESFNMLVPNYMGSWSGDFNVEAAEILQSPNAQNALFNLSVDKFVDEISSEYPGIRRSDVVDLLESGDEQIIQSVEAIYDDYAHKAWAYTSNYWGSQPYTAGPTYLGAAVIFLAVLGLMLLKRRDVVWIVVVSLFALLLAWGGNILGFYEVMFDILPGYSSFRTVSMALVVVEWSVPLFAAIALWQLVSNEVVARKKYVAGGVALAVGVLLYVLMGINADYGVQALVEDMGASYWVEQLRMLLEEVRSEAFVGDAMRSMCYIVLSAGVVVAYVALRDRITTQSWLFAAAVVMVVGVLAVVDIMGVDRRYMNDSKWSNVAPMEVVATKADKEILKDSDLGYRVYDIDSRGSARASNFHRSVDGYHGAKLKRYDDVLHRYIYAENPEVLAMLNTRYTIAGGAVEQNYTFGAAWFVNSAEVKATPAEALEALGVVDLATTAVVESDARALKPWYDNSGYIELVEYAPNYLKYEYCADDTALCVFSEIYYPEGWTAYIDGKEAEYFAVDYILRGMELPAGEHTVEWRFKAPKWGVATAVTGVASWLILLALVAVAAIPAYNRWKKSKKE